jgi:hypothetical protein
MFNGFVGGPNLYLAYAVPQDGIATPNDFNTSVSVNLHALWRGGKNGSVVMTDTTNGWITATYISNEAKIGVSTPNLTIKVPATASLLTGGIGYFYGVVAPDADGSGFPSVALGFSQATVDGLTDSLALTQSDFPISSPFYYNPATYQGGVAAGAPNVWMPAADAAQLHVAGSVVNNVRRTIVEEARCDACHKDLGVFTDSVFHNGQRNDAPSCTFCHNTTGVDSGWTYNIKEAVHSLHAGAKRQIPFAWEPQFSYWNVAYPATLNNCEACHAPGTYDLSAPASAAALNNNQLLWTTVASKTMNIQYGLGAFGVAVPTNINQVLAYTPDANGDGQAPAMGTYLNSSLGNTLQKTGANLALSPFLLPGQVFTGTAYSPAQFTNFFFTDTPAKASNPAAGKKTIGNSEYVTGFALFGNALTVNATPADGVPNDSTQTPNTVQTTADTIASYNAATHVANANPTNHALPSGTVFEAEGTTLVNSPVTSACYACHDTNQARLHMVNNGGILNNTRTSAGAVYSAPGVMAAPGLVNKEQCMVCHGAGAVADIKAVHMNF